MLLVMLALTLTLLAPPPGYEAAAARVPVRHWVLVRSATIDRDTNGQARKRDRSIHLTPYRRAGQLWHEVGHIVRWAQPDLEAAWDRQFWPGGTIRGIPPSKYARTEPDEDFAESYEEILEHGCLEDRERDRFMKSWVFRPDELGPCRP